MSDSAESIGAISFVSNISLAALKILVGATGSSYALIADGIESLADCLSSLIVWNGLRISRRKADHEHPYGHGKAEALAGLLAGIGLLVSAVVIAWHAMQELIGEQNPPAFFTIPALAGVIIAKETLYRFTIAGARQHDSIALRAEAFHHRSDSLTSLVVMGGIVIAVFAGPQYAFFDDLAALMVTGLILYNGLRIIRPAFDELMDRRVENSQAETILETIRAHEPVRDIETLIVRRSGRELLVDVHLEVDPEISVEAGHRIAHTVKDSLMTLEEPKVSHVTTHVEPHHPNP
jgi:cation diffusion facilitator family transporter